MQRGNGNATVRALGEGARRWLQIMVVILTLTALVGPLASPAAARHDDPPLDLAAMALTPEDLERAGLDGYGAAYGWLLTPEQEAARIARVRDLDQADVRDRLEDAGFVRSYEMRLSLPAKPGDSDSDSTRGLFCYIYEFADADGAEDAFAFLSDVGGRRGEEAEGTETIGDESVLVRTEDPGSDGDDPAADLDLVFRSDRFHGRIELWDMARPGEDPEPIEPEVEEAEDLAARLLRRIDDVVEHGGPGLAHQVLRLEVPNPINQVNADRYWVQGEEQIPYYGFLPHEIAESADFIRDWGMVDVYLYEQAVSGRNREESGDPYYMQRLFRFEDEEAAEIWLDQAALAVVEGASGVSEFEPVGGLDDLGDGSAVASYTEYWSGAELSGYTVSVRVDEVVVQLRVMAEDGVEVDTAVELVVAQIACLEDGPCLEPVAAPAGLTAA